MKTRYKLHWASERREFPRLKWEIWDWSIRAPIAHLENRAVGRKVCALLNEAEKASAPVGSPPQEDQELELAPIIPGRNPRSWTMTEAAPVVSPPPQKRWGKCGNCAGREFEVVERCLTCGESDVLEQFETTGDIPAAPVVTQEGE